MAIYQVVTKKLIFMTILRMLMIMTQNLTCLKRRKRKKTKSRSSKRLGSFFSPPNEESEIVGKWFACIYSTKRSPNLFIAKACKRLLVDENGAVHKILLTLLKPKIGSGTVLEKTQELSWKKL